MQSPGRHMKRIHGADSASFIEKYGREPLDFSSGVSPLGMPGPARAAAMEAAGASCGYPDPCCRALRRKIAKRYQMYALRPEDILCGAGAADLIDRFAWAVRAKKALVTAPTFGEYEFALKRTGTQVIRYPLSEENGFCLDPAFPETLQQDLDLVILCEPNNPTGRATDGRVLSRILEKCRELEIFLVLDECYLPFLEDHRTRSRLGDIGRYPLLVLRAFTKYYGMAGLRLGWCACADHALLERMQLAGQPWNVSLPAQVAGIAALDDPGYEKELHTLIREERPFLAGALEKAHCRVIPGEANYLLFYHEKKDLGIKLAKRGILIRDCADFAGLGTGWYRTAVRTREENLQLIKAIEEICR